LGVIGNGKNSSSPFDFGGHSQAAEKIEQFGTKKFVKNVEKKAPVVTVHGNKTIQVCRIGQVATCFAADEDFLAAAIHFSRSKTWAPHSAARPAAIKPDAPPPTTIISVFLFAFVFISSVFRDIVAVA